MGEMLKLVTPDGGLRKKSPKFLDILQKLLNFITFLG